VVKLTIVEALTKTKNDILAFVISNLNNKSDISHEHEVDESLSASSANPVQNRAVNAAISNLNNLVGDTPVSEQINGVISNLTPNVTDDGILVFSKQK
jgi:hypothetical protein